jgi:starvation-inducible DNA-binding protein
MDERTQHMKTKGTHMFNTHIEIPRENREQLVEILNQQLADTFDMFSLMKQAHWNVKGPQFIALHELFDEIAEGILAHVDTIAERATALGGLAMGTVRMAADSSRLNPYPTDIFDSMGTVKFVVEAMADLAATTRNAADLAEEHHDMDTNDMFIEVSRDLDKWLWFLEAHLQA